MNDDLADDEESNSMTPTAADANKRRSRNKLDAAQVLAIRSRYSAGGVTQVALAAEYGVGKDTISDIVTGKTWRHLPLVVPSTTGNVTALPRPRAREVEPSIWEVESSLNAGRVFTIRKTTFGLYCDCPTGRYGSRECWHIAQVEGLLAAADAADDQRRAA